MASTSVKVSGLRELQQAFKKIGGAVAKELRTELITAAQPVAKAAEGNALGRIRNMPGSPQWSGMRVGVSVAKSSVYVVPRAKNRGGSGRANLKSLLLDQAMWPAVEEKQGEIMRGVEQMIDNLAGDNGF